MIQTNIWFLSPKVTMFLCLLYTIAVAVSKEIEVTANFANDYFQAKGVRQIVSFGCWNTDERVKFFMNLKTRMSCISIAENLDLNTILKVNYYKLGVFLDFDCPNSNTIFEQYNWYRLPYNESYFWLMITKHEETALNLLRKLPLSINTEMTLALLEPENCILYDVYNPSYRHGGQLNVTYMGYWKNQKGLKLELNQYKYERRKNFNGLYLNFSIVLHSEPRPDLQTYLTTPIDKHLDNFNRFNYNIVHQLRDYYNFSIHLTRASTWGYLINGSFDGILGDMIKGIVDISATPFQYKIERIDVCEYTVPVYQARTTFIFRHPKSNNIRNSFLEPFNPDVWLLIAITLVIYWCLIYLTRKVEQNYYDQSEEETTCTASESTMIVLASICQQGFGRGPRLYSGRILFLSLLIMGLLIYQFYSAFLVGYLLSEPSRFINTLEDLVNSDLEMGIEDIGYNYDFFATSTDPLIKELHKKKVAPNKKRKKANYMRIAEGIRKVQKGGFAFQTDVASSYKLILEDFTTDEICDLEEIPLFPVKDVSTITAKNSPFKKMVIYGIRKMADYGIADRLKHMWQIKKPVCPESYSSKPTPVPLEKFTPLLFLVFLGCIVAVLIMLGEKFTRKYKMDYQSFLVLKSNYYRVQKRRKALSPART